MSKRDGKDLLAVLRENNRLEYGETILGDEVRDYLGLEEPDLKGLPFSRVKSVLARLQLIEMAAVDHVRLVLLGEGKYLKNVEGNYKILTPSENKEQIGIYIQASDAKNRRALKLLMSTPDEAMSHDERNHMMTRVAMKNASKRHGQG